MGELPRELAPLRDQPDRSALFLDYDGTLAPIVEDPACAVPLPGVPELLSRLAGTLGLVAVVSGRPAAFLREALGRAVGVHLSGLYGMETASPGGPTLVSSEAEGWRPTVAEVTRLAVREAAAGAEVEDKGLTVTLHWRRRPDAAAWAAAFAGREAARTGLRIQPGRMALELRPPVENDKGAVVRRLATGRAAVAFFGDDLGDLPAFAALAELAAAGVSVARVGVVGPGSPSSVAAAADLTVAGPEGAFEILGRLAAGLPGLGR